MKAEYADYMSFGASFSVIFGTHVPSTSAVSSSLYRQMQALQRTQFQGAAMGIQPLYAGKCLHMGKGGAGRLRGHAHNGGTALELVCTNAGE